jgi:hypothetical protein
MVAFAEVVVSCLRRNTEMDRQLLCRLFLDAYSKFVNIHARRRYPDIKELPGCGLFQRKMPLLVSLRGREHCLPVRAAEFNRYSVCRFVCSTNKNMTG